MGGKQPLNPADLLLQAHSAVVGQLLLLLLLPVRVGWGGLTGQLRPPLQQLQQHGPLELRLLLLWLSLKQPALEARQNRWGAMLQRQQQVLLLILQRRQPDTE
jgi:hypothetical protein